MFILSVSKKAKDGNVFRKTLEAVVTYVGSHFGKNVATELQNRMKTTLPLPVIKIKWRAKVAVHQVIVQSKITSYANLVTTIETALVATPNDVNLAEKLINVT